ncbi:hypothetical protein FALCPG4_012903 [Fusarium falciforme]
MNNSLITDMSLEINTFVISPPTTASLTGRIVQILLKGAVAALVSTPPAAEHEHAQKRLISALGPNTAQSAAILRPFVRRDIFRYSSSLTSKTSLEYLLLAGLTS